MGLVILAAVFALPFGSDSSTFYGTVNPLLTNLSGIQGSGYASTIGYSYLLVVAFILLIAAGAVGLFPLGTGVLGVVVMVMITIGPSLIFPGGGRQLSTGIGFYILWAASVVSLGASFWHGKKVTPVATVAPAPSPQQAPAQKS